MNMDWVSTFGWILPRADAANAERHREVGRMVTALFYSELMYKYLGQPDNKAMKRVEARWRLANEERA